MLSICPLSSDNASSRHLSRPSREQ
uniref:Uncharacterized protein n=1 Tax=Arundo donax TaxID=35708 RepID=A0A0A8ZZV9_ARUDO